MFQRESCKKIYRQIAYKMEEIFQLEYKKIRENSDLIIPEILFQIKKIEILKILSNFEDKMLSKFYYEKQKDKLDKETIIDIEDHYKKTQFYKKKSYFIGNILNKSIKKMN